jgi:threonine dehydrogenase-like Zn-dependent dehydrogenase
MLVQEVDPPLPAKGEVLVQVRAVGICGSELEGFASASPFRTPPLIMGHEFAGVVEGSDRLVAVNPIVSCGRCDLCREGVEYLCRSRGVIGITRPGGFAERVAVPEANCHDLIVGMSARQGALVEPFANAIHAFNEAMSLGGPPKVVGVIGAGAIGIAVTQVARRLSGATVTVSDVHRGRLERVRSAGAHHAMEVLSGEFDMVFDCVGIVASRQASTSLIRPGGLAVWIGLHDAEPGFDAQQLIRSGRRILGAFGYRKRDFDDAVGFAAGAGNEWFEEFPLGEGAGAFTRLLTVKPDAPKTILVV